MTDQPSSASSPGSEDSTSPSNTSDSPASRRSNGTPDAPLFSSDTGPASNDGETLLPTPKSQEAGWTPDGEQDPAHRPYQDGQHRSWGIKQVVETLLPTATAGDAPGAGHRQAERTPGSHAGVTLSDWAISDWVPNGVKALTSSAEGSPASPSASPDDGKEPMTSDTSGPSSVASSTRLDPPWSSSRTYLVCSLSDGQWTTEQAALFGSQLLATYSETWPRWGSMRDGQVFEHPTPERRTVESGSGSLHTPTTGDTSPSFDHRASPGYTRDKPVPNLAAQVEEMLPTPGAWLGRRPENSMPDPERAASRRHDGPKGKRSFELPDAIAEIGSLGDPTSQLSADGSE